MGAWAGGGGAKLNTESKGELWLLSNTARVLPSSHQPGRFCLGGADAWGRREAANNAVPALDAKLYRYYLI